VEIFNKRFPDLHDSKRLEKILSSSEFVTAADMVQHDMVEQVTNKSRYEVHYTKLDERTEASDRLSHGRRFARLPWLIYTSHSPCSHYCTD
jgi:hypothetical protein